ncbi:MAG: lycopene cyclase domain-containing protein [Candidatus Omnitrophota bacterium]
MLTMSKYMSVLIYSGLVPFALSFWPPLKIYRYRAALAYSILLILLLFGAWDIFATWRGHWAFNPEGVWNFRIVNLPLEEVLFFVVIPFCCIFTWEAVSYFKRKINR